MLALAASTLRRRNRCGRKVRVGKAFGRAFGDAPKALPSPAIASRACWCDEGSAPQVARKACASGAAPTASDESLGDGLLEASTGRASPCSSPLSASQFTSEASLRPRSQLLQAPRVCQLRAWQCAQLQPSRFLWRIFRSRAEYFELGLAALRLALAERPRAFAFAFPTACAAFGPRCSALLP